MENEGTLNRAVKGGKWVAFTSITSKILGVISFFVLARFLDPASYGLIAIVMMVAGVFNQMIITGFETALMQKKDDVEKYLDSIWTFNILKALVIYGIIALAAPFIADFFHAKDAVGLIRLSGIFVILPALTNVKQLYLFRDFHFHKLYYRDTISQIAYIVVGALWVWLAGPSVWALFWANIARYAFSALVVAWYFPVFPKFTLKFHSLRELIPYSKWVVGQNFVDYLSSLVDNLFIGRLMNPYTLGLYSKARNLAGVAYAPVGGINKNLSFVAFSKVQDETAKLQEGFLMTIDLIMFFGLTNIFLFWLGGDAIIQFFLGSQWVPVVPALKIFTVATLFSSFFGIAYSLFDGSGKPMVTFKAKTMSLAFYAIFCSLGIYWKSMVGAAMGITLSNILICLYAIYKMKKIYSVQATSSIKRLLLIAVPFIPSLLIYFFVHAFSVFVQPFMMIVLLCSLYTIFLFFFWLVGRRYERGCYNTIMTALRILLPKRISTSKV